MRNATESSDSRDESWQCLPLSGDWMAAAMRRNAPTIFVRFTRAMKMDNCSHPLLSVHVFRANLISSVRSSIRHALQLLCGVGIILCLVSTSPAQVDRAGLNGTVTDPSGRVLPQTHITAVHSATRLRREPSVETVAWPSESPTQIVTRP